MKRYGHMIGDRAEYRLRLNGKDVSSGIGNGNDVAAAVDDGENERGAGVQEDTVPVPPLPVREGDGSENVVAAAPPQEPPSLPAIPAPPLPLPPAAGDALNPVDENAEENNGGDGLFVANDGIDEGVKLISKLQHLRSDWEGLVLGQGDLQ